MNGLKERIDMHGHYFPPAYIAQLDRHGMDIIDGVKRPAWSEERQWEYMEMLHIRFSTMSLSSPHVYMGDIGEACETARACNEYGADLVRRHPDRFAALGTLPLPDVEKSVEEIRYCREKLHLDGFALLSNYEGIYLGDPALDQVMEELNREQTVVTIHPTEPSAAPDGIGLPSPMMEYFFDTTRAVTNLLIHGAVRCYPNIRFVVPHAAAFVPVLADRLIPLGDVLLKDRNLDIEGDLRRFYYDLAGYPMPKQYSLLTQVADPTHIVYGSDIQYTFPPLAIRQAQKMDEAFDEGTAERIYKQNALALMPAIRNRTGM